MVPDEENEEQEEPVNNEDEENIISDIEADFEELDKEVSNALDLDDEEGQLEPEESKPSQTEQPSETDAAEEQSEEVEDMTPEEETLEEEGVTEGDEAAEGATLEEEESEAEESDKEQEERQHLKNVIEGALFVAGRPISLEELNTKTGIGKRELVPLLEELMMDYLMRPTALEIVQIQDKYSLQIKPQYTPHVKKFASSGLIPDKYLKTLTIIALKQPIMKSQLIKLRGSGAYEHIKFLEQNGYVKSVKKGRSSELYTTDQFADMFGLSRDIQTMKQQLIAQLGVKDKK